MRKDIKKALEVISEYETNIQKEYTSPNIVGCRVRLSNFGRDMQKPHKRIGTVINYLPWICNPTTDGIATVKWDGVNKPVEMHVSHLEAITEKEDLKGKTGSI